MKPSGFTLIEVLAVAAIIAILSAAFIVNLGPGNKQLALSRAANKLAQDIRRVQEMAMSTKGCSLCGGSAPSGYGIFLEVSSNSVYILYADTITPQGNEFYTPSDTIIEPPYIELGKGIVIQNINTPPLKVAINFRPPDPVTKIKYPSGGSEAELMGDAIITLSVETDPSQTKTVRVNKAGLIWVE